jgi:hypothetical protein
MIAFIALLLGTAAASTTAGSAVTVTVNQASVPYLPLPSGTELLFDTPGPKKLTIEARRRMAGPSQRAQSAPMEALGDGQLILTIKVPGTALSRGTIDDRIGGFPSKSDRSVVTVPPGGNQLTLRAPTGGPDFLVRITDRNGEALLPISGGEQAPPPKPVVSAVTPTPKPAPPPQPTRQKPTRAAPAALSTAAGIDLGLGLPARGSAPVWHLGLTGRLPAYNNLISVGGSMGYHRIRVEETHTVAQPVGGYASQTVDYRTGVVPIEIHAGIHAPAGPIAPVATAGMALFVATRVDGSNRVTNVAVGPSLAIGGEASVGPGSIRLLLGWSEARARFGNTGTGGESVRETLAVSRISTQYLYTF